MFGCYPSINQSLSLTQTVFAKSLLGCVKYMIHNYIKKIKNYHLQQLNHEALLKNNITPSIFNPKLILPGLVIREKKKIIFMKFSSSLPDPVLRTSLLGLQKQSASCLKNKICLYNIYIFFIIKYLSEELPWWTLFQLVLKGF